MSDDTRALVGRPLKLSPGVIEQMREHLIAGMAEQDRRFLELCRDESVDPRASARVAVHPGDGHLVLVAAHERVAEGILRAARAPSRQVTISFERSPILDDEPPSLPSPEVAASVREVPSQSAKDTKTG